MKTYSLIAAVVVLASGFAVAKGQKQISSIIVLNGEATEVATWTSMDECETQTNYLNNVSVGNHYCIEK
jgi:hypothetical protein